MSSGSTRKVISNGPVEARPALKGPAPSRGMIEEVKVTIRSFTLSLQNYLAAERGIWLTVASIARLNGKQAFKLDMQDLTLLLVHRTSQSTNPMDQTRQMHHNALCSLPSDTTASCCSVRPADVHRLRDP